MYYGEATPMGGLPCEVNKGADASRPSCSALDNTRLRSLWSCVRLGDRSAELSNEPCAGESFAVRSALLTCSICQMIFSSRTLSADTRLIRGTDQPCRVGSA
jgi:hypothetical protein